MKNDSIQLIFDENGVADVYDDTYDITIHCKSEQERDKAIKHMKDSCWISIEERLPDVDNHVLLSFSNARFVMIGRYTADDDDGGTFRVGDMDETFAEHNFFVNAWMKLPEPYREDE